MNRLTAVWPGAANGKYCLWQNPKGGEEHRAQKQIQLFAFTNPGLHPLKPGGEGDGLHLKKQRDIQEIPVDPFTGIGHSRADPTKPLPRNAVQVLWKGFKWGVPEVARVSGVRVDINLFSSDRAPTFNCRVEYLIHGLHYNYDHLVDFDITRHNI